MVSTAKETGLVAAGVEYSKVAVQITHNRSNRNRTQFERTRMLFDFVRAAFADPRTAGTDLSRRLRDGVSLSLRPPSLQKDRLEVDSTARTLSSPER
jgi:hypothetical protein